MQISNVRELTVNSFSPNFWEKRGENVFFHVKEKFGDFGRKTVNLGEMGRYRISTYLGYFWREKVKHEIVYKWIDLE